jgi:Fe2+ or Zn2+ uptake regulation protein
MESALLHQHGYRLTPQRYVILRLLEQTQEHLSAAQILQQAQAQNPQITLPTVYRTLDLLKELGLVIENHLTPEQATYEARQGRAHHHLLCQGCQSVIHLDANLLGALHEEIEQHYHYHGVMISLSAVGYCAHCSQALKAWGEAADVPSNSDASSLRP